MTDIDKRKMERAAAFVRVSTERQAGDNETSLDDQRKDIAGMAEREGWEIVGDYEEPGTSGKLKLVERPEVQRLMADAADGAFDVVVFWDNKRMGRNSREVIDFADDLRELGVLVAFTTPYAIADYYDENDQMLFMMNSHFSERDLKSMAKTQARGRYNKALEGQWPGGTPFLGWETNKDRRIVIHEGEAKVVRRAFQLVGADGLNATEAARVLSKEFPRDELPVRGGGKVYTNQHIHDTIKRSAYFGGGIARMIRPFPNIYDPKEEIMIPAPALVDEELWRKANAVLAGRAESRKPTSEWQIHDYAFDGGRVQHRHPDGKLFTMHGAGRERNRRTDSFFERIHRCRASIARRGQFGLDDPDACEGFGYTAKHLRRTSIDADQIESRFLIEIVARLRDPESFKAWIQEEDSKTLADDRRGAALATTPEEQIAAAATAIEDLDAESEVINRQEQKGRISEEDADIRHADIERRRGDIIAVRVRAMQEQDQDNLRTTTLDELLAAPIGVGVFYPGSTEREVMLIGNEEQGYTESVESPGWEDAAEYLTYEAGRVLDGSQRTLPKAATAWAARLAEVLDIRLVVSDSGGDDPNIEATGLISLGATLTGPLQRHRQRLFRRDSPPGQTLAFQEDTADDP